MAKASSGKTKAASGGRGKKADKKRRSVFGRILLCLGCLLLAAIVFLFTAPLTETDRSGTVAGSASWMASLPDDIPLNELTIPGTHDSATAFCQLAYITKCQYHGIGAQLQAGYRFLDIRLGIQGEDLILMHGFTKCRTGAFFWDETLTLESVLADCYDFLKANPTETILFSVKQEHGDESVKEFQALLRQHLAKASGSWLLTDTLPTLGEARGKIVLLRRYADEAGLGREAGIPFLWDHQGGHDDITLDTVSKDNGTYTLWVQDRYEFDTDDKWNAFVRGILNSRTGDGHAAVQFLSTKGSFVQGHPYAFARKLNQTLTLNNIPAGCGWIVVDFGTAVLAQHIYLSNFSR